MLLLILLQFSATDKSAPRVEAQITWNGDFFATGVGVNLWVDGTYQYTERTEAEAAASKSNTYLAATTIWLKLTMNMMTLNQLV